MIARQPVTNGDDSFVRAEWDLALHHALVARAAELAVTVPADAVEKALRAALEAAKAAGRWSDVAQLASELEGRRKAKAGTVDLGAERARRGGQH